MLKDKLLLIQKSLKAPKNQFNNFGKYHYRSCEDILEALKPLLNDCVLTVTDEVIMIGNRYYIKATAKLSDSTGEENCVSAYAREEESKKGMDGAQVTGSASSYARKYALNGLFLIDDTKDADSTNKHGKENVEAKESEKQAKVNNEVDAPNFDPPPESNDNVIFQKIKNVSSKEGTTNGKTWKAFWIETVTGDKYGTFSETLADLANSFKTSGELVKIEWKSGKKQGSKELVSISK